jgi:hypothetical protein
MFAEDGVVEEVSCTVERDGALPEAVTKIEMLVLIPRLSMLLKKCMLAGMHCAQSGAHRRA